MVAVNLVKEVVDLGAEGAKDRNLLNCLIRAKYVVAESPRGLKSGAKLGKLWIANSLLLPRARYLDPKRNL